MADTPPPPGTQPCLTKLRALADPVRMRLIKALARGESPVTGLAESQGLTIYNASRHLKVLREAGLVETEISAQQRIYRLKPILSAGLGGDENVLQLGCCSFRLDEIES